jgi:hypothetical protein
MVKDTNTLINIQTGVHPNHLVNIGNNKINVDTQDRAIQDIKKIGGGKNCKKNQKKHKGTNKGARTGLINGRKGADSQH